MGELRRAYDSSAALGVAAHITLLFPFLDGEAIDEAVLAELFARFNAFDFTLDRVEQFDDGVVWLHPSPSLRFADLTAAIHQRWPSHPPYEGAFDETIPHLTVSETPIDLQIALPIAAHAHEVTLIEQAERTGRWAARARFPLG